jgi:uncharacterized lipoprotein YddW (UPF0748 family)
MTKKIIPIILILILITLYPKASASSTEIRGIWYNAFAIPIPNNETLAQIKLYEDFNYYHTQNITEVFFNIKYYDQSLYNSTVLTNIYDFDLLALACQIANNFNISIHAWIPLQTTNDDWEQISISGEHANIYNFALPDVQNHIFAIVNEIVQNYSIKGIHLDYIRYESKDYSYDDYSINTFINLTGIDPRTNPDNPQWYEWREQQITNIVNQTKIIAKSHDLTLKISVASFREGSCVIQDWYNWLNQRLIDFACPMNYETSVEAFEFNIKVMVNRTDRNRLLIGIGAYQINQTIFNEQIQIVRKYGCAGFVIFRDIYFIPPPLPPEPQSSQSSPWYQNPYVFAIVIIAIMFCLYIFKKV